MLLGRAARLVSRGQRRARPGRDGTKHTAAGGHRVKRKLGWERGRGRSTGRRLTRGNTPDVERRPRGRGEGAHARHERLAVLGIGHDLPAFQPPEDDVVHRPGRRFRTKCGRASSRAWRGIVGLGLLSAAGGASQEKSTESTTSRITRGCCS